MEPAVCCVCVNATLEVDPMLGAGSDDVGYICCVAELGEVTDTVESTKLLL